MYKNDFWEFDPTSEIWTRKQDLNEEDDYRVIRSNTTGFSLNGFGYVVGGNNNGVLGSVWEYSPGSDDWEEINRLEALDRQDPVSFSNGSRAFVLLGRSGSLYLDDVYELFPQEEFNEDD